MARIVREMRPCCPQKVAICTDVPDVDTGIDWLVYLAQYSLQCQAQSRFVVRSRLDIVENTEIMVAPISHFIAVLFDRTVVHLGPEYSPPFRFTGPVDG